MPDADADDEYSGRLVTMRLLVCVQNGSRIVHIPEPLSRGVIDPLSH